MQDAERISTIEKEAGQLERRFSLRSAVRSVSDRQGVVVLNISRGEMLGTNETGGEIWQGIERGWPLREIVTRLSESTGTPVDLVGRDVIAFADDLLARGLIVEVGDHTSHE